jgi:predicted molibdopterin-dependent oxidoreductase YjgC
VRGNSENPTNQGQLCVRGRFGWRFVHSPDRLTSPLIQHNGRFTETSWDEALELVAGRLKMYKSKEFALIASTKSTNEDNFIAQKFSRIVMGSNNIDSSVRFSHAFSMNALYEKTGSRTLTSSLKEIEGVPCILVAGTNITQTHPIARLKIKKAVENGASLIVISSHETDLCRLADVWLRPYPGSDVALLMGICGVISDEGLLDQEFITEKCENFEDFKASLDNFTLGRVERITGIERDRIVAAAKLYAANKPASILWTKEITQHPYGIDTVLSFINLAILTGNIKEPFSLNPLWDQNNALGACDMGCLPEFYPGYQPVASSEVRKRFESSWGKSLNPESGLNLSEMIQAADEGKIKALYIIGSDPVSNIPNKKVKEALKKAELVVVQDIFLNETAKFADVIFPAASFAEKNGTFTNTDGHVQKINKALETIGSSKPDWQILCELAKKTGCKGFDFNSPEEIMSEISAVTPLYMNISSGNLNERGVQILNRDEESMQKSCFRFTPLEYRAPAEKVDIDYPFILISKTDVYSAGLLSRKVEGLHVLRTKGHVQINPKDAMDFEIEDGTIVKVTSRYGDIMGEAEVTEVCPAGIVTTSLTAKDIQQLMNTSQENITDSSHANICAVRIVPQKASPDE